MAVFDFSRVIVFGGTTEGRLVADRLDQMGRLLCVCVATKYGEEFLKNPDSVKVGRLDSIKMLELFNQESPSVVIDATHPYATEVTQNIIEACNRAKLDYIRVKRECDINTGENIYKFTSLDEMIDWINNQEGIIFSTLGVKEAKALTKITDYKERVYLRVLPVDSSIQICSDEGYDRCHVIDAMGPFSYEQNVKMIKNIKADILLTKDSGKAGGFLEKLKAAADCNIKTAVLIRPKEEEQDYIFDIDKILELIDKSE